MPNQPSTSLTFYNAYCFDLSPTYDAWAKLTAADVHALKEREGFQGQSPSIYFYLNHPIRYVRLVGVVVAFDVYEYRYIMVLDDSSGENIEVTCGRAKEPSLDAKPGAQQSTGEKTKLATGKTVLDNKVNLTGVDVGSVVKAKGLIGSFRGVKQVQLERLSIVGTTNEEVKAWTENTAFRRDVLSKPWVLTEKEEKRAKRKAEGYEARRKAKEEHKGRKEALERERRGRGEKGAKRKPHAGISKREIPRHHTIRNEQCERPIHPTEVEGDKRTR